jgi:hypothetical protein
MPFGGLFEPKFAGACERTKARTKTIFETSAALSAIPGFETLSGWTSAQDFAVIIEAMI